MKKNLSKLATFALTSAMLLGTLAGCNGSETTPSSQTEAPAKTEAAAATATPAGEKSAVDGMEGWEAFGDKVHIKVPVYDRSKEGYPAVDDNYWTKYVQTEFGDKWNVDVEYVAIPRGDVMTKYSLLIAGSDTPTIMMEYDYPKVAQWASDGAMQPISLDEFKQVAPNYYQKMVDNNQLGYTDINGETFFVLSERPYYNTTYSYVNFIRKDWLDAVNMPSPTNYAEKAAAIDAIIAAGLTDQPVGLSLPTTAYIRNFPFRDFPVNETEWAMHSSLGTPSLSWEPSYKFLKRQNAEFNKGWFSKEYDLDADGSSGDTSSQQKTDFINGKLYIYGGYMAENVDWLSAFYEKNPNAVLEIENPNVNVEPGFVEVPALRADNPFGMIIGFSSLADANQLKAAWMLMEWMLQPEILYTMENGVEGVTYKLDENGIAVVDSSYRGPEMLNHNNNIDMTCLVHAAKTIGTIEQSIGVLSPKGLPQDFTQAMIDNYYELQAIANKGWAYSDPVFAVTIASEAEYSAPLLSLYQEYSVALTKCKPEEYDALYADLSKKFVAAGYQEVINERLAAYEAGQTTKLPK